MTIRPAAAARPLLGRRIMLDPGHGGEDRGAMGPTGVREKDVNLSVALRLRHELRELGAQVRMTRTTDDSVAPPGSSELEDLQARVRLANSWPADVYLSVHCNAFVRPEKRGTEAYHARQASQESRRLARGIQDRMVRDGGLEDSGVRQADFYVLRHTGMPAVLAEMAYLTNAEDEALLADPEVQDRLARAMADGITDALAGEFLLAG